MVRAFLLVVVIAPACVPFVPTGQEGEEGEGEEGEGEEFVLATVKNGSFENTTLAAGCYDNLSNDELGDAFPDVTGFGTFDQVDVYAGDDCFGSSSDGVFHIGLGADDDTDAVALALDDALVDGHAYVVTLDASFGETGGDTSTNLLIGASSSATSFGTQIGETGLLPSEDPTAFSIPFTAGSDVQFVTLKVELDGNLGWAMVDDVRLADGE